MKRTWILSGAVVLVGILVLLRSLAFVPDDEMAPSYFAGDLVVLTGGTPKAGDVVAVVDPLEPRRWTLRRVEAVGGAVRYTDGAFRTSAEPVQVLDMGMFGDRRVHKQGAHLVTHLDRPIAWDLDEETIPDDAAFVSADARDEAMDSRWWGAVPLGAIQGVVRLRVGVPTTPWRTWVTLGG